MGITDFYRGMLDFVRRRKLSRIAAFRPDHFLPKEVYAQCDFCDSDVVDMLSVCYIFGLFLFAIPHDPLSFVP
jgi:hypothetical protein